MTQNRFLWMDDNPAQITTILDALKVDGLKFEADVATSIDEARQYLKSERYTAFIADCEMDPRNKSDDNTGASFLLEVNEQLRWMPSFAYTSFVNDRRFAKALEESDAIEICEKTETFTFPLRDDVFLRSIILHSKKCADVIGFSPEKIQFKEYMNAPEKYRQSYESHWKRHEHWILREMKRRNYLWVIVIGEKVIDGGENLNDFPSEEELIDLGKKYNLIPFAYSTIEDPESIDDVRSRRMECNWKRTNIANDFYPTLNIEIGGNVLCEDFDTGACQTQVSDELVPRGPLDAIQRKVSNHLGRDIVFTTKKISIKLFDIHGAIREVSLVVRIIEDWVNSSFRVINSARNVLIGRDLLHATNLNIHLNSRSKSTEVYFLDDEGKLDLPNKLYPEMLPFNTARFKVSNIHELYFEEYGNPNGKPVVVIHGGPGAGMAKKSHRFFDPDGYRIILFDQRGCGNSTPHACIMQNTTDDLIQDIEKLRLLLEIPCWQVFGGSWGSTLALAYAQIYPSSVSELVLRGIFMLRKEELSWFYQKGVDMIFPDEWQNYIAPIASKYHDNLIEAYHDLLNGDDIAIQLSAAKAWSTWEARLSTMNTNEDLKKRANDDMFALAFAKIENHYFKNLGFFANESQLLDNIDKIRHIPTFIVQGRYDMVCPMKTAWDLYQVFPEAIFKEVRNAGHSAFESEIASELVAITNFLISKK